MVEVVEKWGNENPVSTRLFAFLEMFPNAEMELNLESGKYFPDFCVRTLDKAVECLEGCYGGCRVCKEKFWEEEV